MFAQGPKGTFAEELSRYGSKVQSEKNTDLMGNLFADLADDSGVKIPQPPFPKGVEPWPTLERLNKEKDLVGIYLSAHPLDDYAVALKYVVNTHMTDFDLPPEEQKAKLYNKQISCGGLVTNVREGMTKKNNPYAIVTVEDYEGSHEFALFGEDYMNLANRFHKNVAVYIEGQFKSRFQWSKPTDALEFKIGTVQLLSSVKEQLVKKMTITISEDKIDDMFVSEFLPLLQENQGEVLLYLHVHEQSTGKTVPLFARKCKVNASYPMIERLQQMSDDGLLMFYLN